MILCCYNIFCVYACVHGLTSVAAYTFFCNLDDRVRLFSQAGQDENLTAGRLEIFINDEWGTVCGDTINPIISDIACQQLGLSSSGAVYGTARNLGYAH